jgi:hypothetical protein
VLCRKIGSTQHQRDIGTDQKEQVVSLIFFSVPSYACGGSLFLTFIESADFLG